MPGFDFLRHAVEAQRSEAALMLLAVVFHRVSTADNFAAQFGVQFDLAADAEKSRPGLIAVENIQYLWGYFRVGAIVDGEGDVAGLYGRLG